MKKETKDILLVSEKSVLGGVLNGTTETISKGGSVFRNIRRLLLPERVRPSPESFDQAVVRLGLTVEILAERESAFNMIATTWAALAMLVGAWGIFMMSPLPTSLSIFLLAVCAANWFNFNMRLWQVRHRTLCSVGEFIKQPDWYMEWLN